MVLNIKRIHKATTFPGLLAQVTPVTAAGLYLARFVLWIAAGSIFGLIAYLALTDYEIGTDIRAAYEQVLNPSRIGSEFYTPGQLDKLSFDLDFARKNPNWQMPQDSLKNTANIMGMLKQLLTVSTTQKAQLDECIPLLSPENRPSASPNKKAPPSAGQAGNPPSTSRNEKLDSCIGIIEVVRRADIEAAASLTNAQVMADSVTKLNEHRQSLHTFWGQAAQLIFLNLLLPLLTALFGYIFGTHQAQQQG